MNLLGSRGELGLGDLEERKEPVLLEALGGLTVTQVSAGGWHNLALGEEAVYAWGWNESGQLGLETVVQVNKRINNISLLSKPK